MESLTDLRQARFENVSGDRAGTEQRSQREWTAGREEYPSEYQVHYQEDFGTTMSDDQYKTLSENQSKFKESVAGAKSSVEDVRAEVQALYSEQNKKLDSYLTDMPSSFSSFRDSLINNPVWYESVKKDAYADPFGQNSSLPGFDDNYSSVYKPSDSAIETYAIRKAKEEYVNYLSTNQGFMSFYNDWAEGNTVKVVTSNPKDPSTTRTFNVLPEAATSIGAIDFQGYGSVSRDSDGTLYVSSDSYIEGVNKSLESYKQDLYASLGESYAPSIQSSVDKSRGALEEEYTLSQEGLASQQRQIAAKEEENLSSLNLIRSTYANKLKGMSESIGSMNYAKSN